MGGTISDKDVAVAVRQGAPGLVDFGTPTATAAAGIA